MMMLEYLIGFIHTERESSCSTSNDEKVLKSKLIKLFIPFKYKAPFSFPCLSYPPSNGPLPISPSDFDNYSYAFLSNPHIANNPLLTIISYKS